MRNNPKLLQHNRTPGSPRSSLIALSIVIVASQGLGLAQSGEPRRASRPALDENVSVLFDQPLVARGASGSVAISLDGSALAYTGAAGLPRGLYVRHLDTHAGKQILKNFRGLDEFSGLGFSPDGKRVIFSVGGPSWYYPRVIGSVLIDGSGAVQLTGGAALAPELKSSGESYSAAQPSYSPDGTEVTMWVYTKNDVYYLGLLPASAVEASPQRLAEVQSPPAFPWFWSIDGKAVFYSDAGTLRRLVLETGHSDVLMSDSQVLGRVAGEDAIFVRVGSAVAIIDLRNSMARDAKALHSIRTEDSAGGVLSGIQNAGSRYVLTYSGPTGRHVEVLALP